MTITSPAPQWKVALGIGFSILWAAVGPMLISVEGQRAFEEAPEFAGRVMGQGIAFGLVAALFAHFLVLRQADRKFRGLNYVAAIIVGAISSYMIHTG